jgi:hypothetical protein
MKMDYERYDMKAEAKAHKETLECEAHNARLEAERMAHWHPVYGLEGYDPFWDCADVYEEN